MNETTGIGFTVTTTWAVLLQFCEEVPVTTYVVVVPGVAIGFGIELLFKPVGGFHAYELAPLAVNCTFPPEQTEAGDGLIIITGNGFTVITVDIEEEQPFAAVPVTVYVVVLVGEAFTEEVVEFDKPTDGDHV